MSHNITCFMLFDYHSQKLELLYFLCFPSFYATTAKCVEDQRSLLLQMKKNLMFKLEKSRKLKTRNQSISCCSWSGVTCNTQRTCYCLIDLDLSGEHTVENIV